MNSREKLYEDYEEALFALLMDKVIELEGAAYIAENNRLKENAEFVVSENLNERCFSTIERAVSERKAQSNKTRSSKVLRLVLSVAVVISLLFTTAYATMPEVKYAVMNAIVRFSDIETSFSFEPDQNKVIIDEELQFVGYNIPLIPAEYELVEEGNEVYVFWRVYSSDESTIRIEIVTNEKYITHSVDTEGASINEAFISGYRALITEENNIARVVLFDEDNGAIINLRGENVDIDLIIQIATEIKLVK